MRDKIYSMVHYYSYFLETSPAINPAPFVGAFRLSSSSSSLDEIPIIPVDYLSGLCCYYEGYFTCSVRN